MPTRARVVILEGAYGVAAIREVELPDPGPGQVAVLIYAGGVGHAQLQQLAESRAVPRLMGSEGSGRVTAVGPGGSHVAVGDFVIIGRDLAGEGRTATTVVLDDGRSTEAAAVFTWATNVVLDAAHVAPLEGVADREAAAILGGTVREAVATVRATVKAGDSVVVFGLAGTGLALVAAAREVGAARIIGVDRDEERLARALELGATHRVSGTPAQALAEVTAIVPEGAHQIFDCFYDYRSKNRPGTHLLAEGGSAWLVGTAGTAAAETALEEAQAEFGYESRPSAAGYGSLDAIALMDPSRLVTARYTIEQVNEALRDLEGRTVVGSAVLVMEPLT